MTASNLDISGFRDAVKTLGTALNAFEVEPENDFIRDACIKRFEYCYEFATKMITRHLSLTEDDPIEVKAMTFQDKIRRAYEIGLIPNSWEKWWHYRDDRAATAHGYSKERAEALVDNLPEFHAEMETLLTSLERIYETEI